MDNPNHKEDVPVVKDEPKAREWPPPIKEDTETENTKRPASPKPVVTQATPSQPAAPRTEKQVETKVDVTTGEGKDFKVGTPISKVLPKGKK